MREEILADARRERDEILQRAQQEAEAILANAKAEAAKTKQERLAQAREEADRRRELILATVPVEAGRLRSTRVETLLQSVHDEVRKRLVAKDGFDYREAMIALAAEAVGQMAGNAFVMKLSPPDRTALGDTLARAVTQGVAHPTLSVTLVIDPTIAEGGVIVEDAGGRQSWDNRLPPRLQRLWPELRRQIAVQTSLVASSSHAGGDA